MGLLEKFLEAECGHNDTSTPYVRGLLGGAAAPPNTQFTFNLFNVTVRREEGVVLIEDVLDAGTDVLRVPLAEFSAALGKHFGVEAGTPIRLGPVTRPL